MLREVIRPWPPMAEHNTPFVPAMKIKLPGATMLIISGMGPMPPVHKHPHVPEEWNLPDDAAEQARRALNKFKYLVETAGGKFEHIVKITRYLKDINDQDRVNEVIHEYFGENLPCSTTVQVVGFVVPTMKLEFDCWAIIPDGDTA
jgi:2-iminobutanoate/2-iminopropanoate deaminase